VLDTEDHRSLTLKPCRWFHLMAVSGGEIHTKNIQLYNELDEGDVSFFICVGGVQDVYL
jgi:hypothetical protein